MLADARDWRRGRELAPMATRVCCGGCIWRRVFIAPPGPARRTHSEWRRTCLSADLHFVCPPSCARSGAGRAHLWAGRGDDWRALGGDESLVAPDAANGRTSWPHRGAHQASAGAPMPRRAPAFAATLAPATSSPMPARPFARANLAARLLTRCHYMSAPMPVVAVGGPQRAPSKVRMSVRVSVTRGRRQLNATRLFFAHRRLAHKHCVSTIT